MSRVRWFSDLHLECGPFDPGSVASDVVVLAGDIWTKGRCVPWEDAESVFGCPVVMVLGNHEFYGMKIDTAVSKLKKEGSARGVTILENDEIVVAGIRILGCTLWTDFRLFAGNDLEAIKRDATFCVGERQGSRLNDFWNIRVAAGGYRKFRPDDAARLHQASVRWLDERLSMPFDGPTIVVSHHAPSARSIPEKLRTDRYSCAYASNLEWLIEKHRPAAWLHGHIHDAVPFYEICGTRIMSNPRGYLPHDVNPRFDPSLVVEISSRPQLRP